jgi:uncharacterized protein (TIGR03435 family)
MGRVPVTVVATMTLLLSAVTFAQQPGQEPAFEVATIRVNTAGPGPAVRLTIFPGGRVVTQNTLVRDVIIAAHGLEDSQLLGGPGWLGTLRIDVDARAGGEVSVDGARTMLRRLLTERFRFAAHTETRQLPIYDLVMARSDRSLGRTLRRSSQPCTPVTLPADMPPAMRVPPPPGGMGTAIGVGGGFRCPSALLPGHLSVRGVSMTALAGILWRRVVQRPVLDRTGLAGEFDLDLTYLPELENINGRPASESPLLPQQITGAPSIFTAVQEQLGLKLDSTRGPVDVLVIDRIEPPTEN